MEDITTDGQQPMPITVTMKEAEKILGLGKDNIVRLVRSGRLRSIRAGRRILIPWFEIDDFLKREITQEGGK